MKTHIHALGMFLLILLVYGCATQKPVLVPIPEPVKPPPEFVEVDIQPETAETESSAQKPIIAKVTSYRLNLRKKSTKKGRILGVLKKGEEVAVQMKKGKWVSVYTRKGLQGWVHGRYIKSTGEMEIDDALAAASSGSRSKPAVKTMPVTKKGGVKKSDEKKSHVRKSANKGDKNPVFRTPINRAVKKMLRKTGNGNILKTVTTISSSNLGSFAIANIEYKKKGKKARTKAYLFKLKDRWVAYNTIPSRLNHPGVFWMLAQSHCAKTFKAFQGMGYGESAEENNVPYQRTVSFICSELIDRRYEDHSLRFTYNFEKKNGWKITDVLEVGPVVTRNVEQVDSRSAKSISQLSLELASRTEKERLSDEVVDRFFISILVGDMDAVKGLLNAGLSPNVKRPRLGHSPLYAAVIGHQYDIAQLFIDKGADVGFKAENGLTPLILAAGSCQSASLVKALINAGADVNARSRSGETPLMAAKGMNCHNNIGMLKRAGAR